MWRARSFFSIRSDAQFEIGAIHETRIFTGSAPQADVDASKIVAARPVSRIFDNRMMSLPWKRTLRSSRLRKVRANANFAPPRESPRMTVSTTLTAHGVAIPALGFRASGVKREDIFITTKVSHEYLRADDFARSVDASLKALKLDYVDLLMVHWPNPEIPLSEPMPALAKAKRQGLARHVGVANFNTT